MHPYHFTAPLHLKSLDAQGTGQIAGYASVFNITDNQGDIVAKGSFSESLQTMKNGPLPKMLWQHQVDTPIGKWNLLKEDDHGLYVEGTILLSLSKGREVFEMIKNKMVDGLSIGCHVIESQKGSNPSERILTKVDLLEISLVTFAANQQAKVLSIKGFKTYQQRLLEAIEHAKNILTSAPVATTH